MKNTIAILITLLVVGFGVFVFVLLKNSSTPTTPITDSTSGTGASNVLPNVPSTYTPPPAPIINTFSIHSIAGGVIKVRDFEKDPTTVADKNNAAHYYLYGFFSASNPDPAFTITYSQSDQSFTVALWKKPLGQTRSNAEQFLQKALGITKVQMCNLNYYISVSDDVDPQYQSANLGFSFCPGATALQ